MQSEYLAGADQVDIPSPEATPTRSSDHLKHHGASVIQDRLHAEEQQRNRRPSSQYIADLIANLPVFTQWLNEVKASQTPEMADDVISRMRSQFPEFANELPNFRNLKDKVFLLLGQCRKGLGLQDDATKAGAVIGTALTAIAEELGVTLEDLQRHIVELQLVPVPNPDGDGDPDGPVDHPDPIETPPPPPPSPPLAPGTPAQVPINLVAIRLWISLIIHLIKAYGKDPVTCVVVTPLARLVLHGGNTKLYTIEEQLQGRSADKLLEEFRGLFSHSEFALLTPYPTTVCSPNFCPSAGAEAGLAALIKVQEENESVRSVLHHPNKVKGLVVSVYMGAAANSSLLALIGAVVAVTGKKVSPENTRQVMQRWHGLISILSEAPGRAGDIRRKLQVRCIVAMGSLEAVAEVLLLARTPSLDVVVVSTLTTALARCRQATLPFLRGEDAEEARIELLEDVLGRIEGLEYLVSGPKTAVLVTKTARQEASQYLVNHTLEELPAGQGAVVAETVVVTADGSLCTIYGLVNKRVWDPTKKKVVQIVGVDWYMVDATRVVCLTSNPRRSRGNGAVHHSAALLPSVMMAEDTLTITTNSQPTKNAPRPQLQLSRASQVKIAAEAVTEEASLDGTILYLAQGGRLLPGNEAEARTQFFDICQDVYKKAGFGDLSPEQWNCLMNVFPIIVGLFVGDGFSVKAAIATNKEDLDQGIQKVLEEFAGNFHLKLVAKADKRKGKHEGTCTIDFVPKTEGGSNFLWLLLQKLEFVGGGDRSFPTATLTLFLSLSRGFQLCVLAGAMAADGHVVVSKNGQLLYIITQGILMRKRDDPTNLYRSHLQIAYALSKLAESLGLGGGMSFVENLGNGVITVTMAGAIVEDLRIILQGFMPRKAAQRAPFKRMPRAANLRTVGSTDPSTQGVVHGGKVLVGIPQTSEGPVRILQSADGYFIFFDRLSKQFPGGANLRQLVSWADTADEAHCKVAYELRFPNDIREDDSVVQEKRKRRNKDRSVDKSAADDVPPKRVFMRYAVPNKYGGYGDPMIMWMYNIHSDVYTEEENEYMYATDSYPGYYL